MTIRHPPSKRIVEPNAIKDDNDSSSIECFVIRLRRILLLVPATILIVALRIHIFMLAVDANNPHLTIRKASMAIHKITDCGIETAHPNQSTNFRKGCQGLIFYDFKRTN